MKRRRIPRSSETENAATSEETTGLKMLPDAQPARRTKSAVVDAELSQRPNETTILDARLSKFHKNAAIISKNRKSGKLVSKDRMIEIPVISSMPEISIEKLCAHLDYVIYENKYSLNHRTNALNLGKIFDRNISSIKNVVDGLYDSSKFKIRKTNFSSVDVDRGVHARRIDAGSEKTGENEHRSSAYFTVHHGLLMHRTAPVPVPCLSFIRGHYKMAWRDTVR